VGGIPKSEIRNPKFLPQVASNEDPRHNIPMTDTARAVILLSGGLDSTTVLAIARSEDLECHCLTVD
jgi:tRNA(Ile)-lysidine synthase TilS/MesJ